jgi:hypothetical protein
VILKKVPVITTFDRNATRRFILLVIYNNEFDSDKNKKIIK